MLRLHQAARLGSGLLSAVFVIALGEAAVAAPTMRSAPAGPVRTFNVAPTTFQAHGVRYAAGKKPSFKYFELTAGARGNTRDIALGHDGNLWVTTDCLATIERVTPKGVTTAFTYAGAASCSTSTSITPGPDGNLWFADQFNNFVGKISTKGVVTEYHLPAASPCNFYPSAPLGIVAGPDGAMWFTVTYPGNPFCSGQGAYAPAIGRITTKGKMTFFYTAPVGTVHTTSPERIISGTDGSLYFVANADQNGNHLLLGRVTTAGAISYSSAFGSSGSFADTLAYGSDGNLWMTNYQDQQIVRFSGSQITSFPTGTYNGIEENAYGLALGSDGALWFTTFDDNEIGRITADGQVSYYPSAACSPGNCGSGGGIVRDGKNLWHTLPGNREAQDVVEISKLP